MLPDYYIQEVTAALEAPNVLIFANIWELHEQANFRTSRPDHTYPTGMSGCIPDEVKLSLRSSQSYFAYALPQDQLYAFCHCAHRRKNFEIQRRHVPHACLQGVAVVQMGSCVLFSSKLHTIIYFLKAPLHY